MKKILLSLVALSSCLAATAQCTDLFISEYVEGTGNNKAIEIFNPTPNPINLNNQYRMVRYNNGTNASTAEANAQASINLGSHTLASGEAWVIVINLVDPAGTGQNAPAATALQAVADTFLCPDYNTSYTMYFNGNDALSLQKTSNGGTTWNYVDIFGMIGDAAMVAGQSWSDQFPYDGSVGKWWTKDHSLFRKQTVKQGVTVNPSPEFIVTAEWDSLPVNTYTNLGAHVCDCPTTGIKEIDNSVSVKIFPNPSNENYFAISSTEAIEYVEIYNMLGQEMLNKRGNKTDKAIRFETTGLPKGIYFVRISCLNNKHAITKLTIQ